MLGMARKQVDMIRHSRRLIVGSAGATNAFGTIESVREWYGDGIFLIAIDTGRRELTAASVLADAFVQVPLARAPEFPGVLRDLAMAHPGSYYLPLHDEEIEVAARLALEGALRCWRERDRRISASWSRHFPSSQNTPGICNETRRCFD